MKENPCSAEKCPRKCYEISEERRKSLHDHFWSLDILRRRDWILRCAQAVPIKRRKRSAIDNNRRQAAYEYTINQGKGHTQVCQKFLLNTLCISQKYLSNTIKNAHENTAQCDKRRPNVTEIYSEDAKQYVRTYIGNLPAIPSHYNRKRSNKTYLPQEFKNVSNLFRLYSEHCKSMQNEDNPDAKYQIVSERLFRNIFCEYNISCHVPKKDKFVPCTKNENNQNSVSNEEVQNHIAEKKPLIRGLRFIKILDLNTTILLYVVLICKRCLTLLMVRACYCTTRVNTQYTILHLIKVVREMYFASLGMNLKAKEEVMRLPLL